MSDDSRTYTSEFREQAVRLVLKASRPLADVAAERGVGEQELERWVRSHLGWGAAEDTCGGTLNADERAELERLRRENVELRLDREFLERAAVYFVPENDR